MNLPFPQTRASRELVEVAHGIGPPFFTASVADSDCKMIQNEERRMCCILLEDIIKDIIFVSYVVIMRSRTRTSGRWGKRSVVQYREQLGTLASRAQHSRRV